MGNWALRCSRLLHFVDDSSALFVSTSLKYPVMDYYLQLNNVPLAKSMLGRILHVAARTCKRWMSFCLPAALLRYATRLAPVPRSPLQEGVRRRLVITRSVYDTCVSILPTCTRRNRHPGISMYNANLTDSSAGDVRPTGVRNDALIRVRYSNCDANIRGK